MASKRTQSRIQRNESPRGWLRSGSFAEDLVGLDVTCLDPSEAMLKVAKKRVDGARASRGEAPAAYVQALAEDIPLEDNTFDMVFCLFSFRDFQDKKKGLEEIYRVLKPGGQLVMCDAGKANYLHGLTGRIWMSTVVQWMAGGSPKPRTILGKGSLVLTRIIYQQILQEYDERCRFPGSFWSASVSVHDVESIPWTKTAVVHIICMN